MNPNGRLYQHAQQDRGLAEVPGKKSHPRIKQAINLAADWLDDDDSVTAWCGCIRGLWGYETGTGVPPAHYRAKSWLNWGTPVALSQAQEGDTVIFKRKGGYHVALFEKLLTDKVRVFGGNQSNACNSANYARADVVGVRRLIP